MPGGIRGGGGTYWYSGRDFLLDGPVTAEDEAGDGGDVLRVGTAGVAGAAAIPGGGVGGAMDRVMHRLTTVPHRQRLPPPHLPLPLPLTPTYCTPPRQHCPREDPPAAVLWVQGGP
jgi:hypothetical protein